MLNSSHLLLKNPNVSNFSADRLVLLHSEMQLLLQEEERIRKDTEKVLAKAKNVIDPREQFNKWLKSSSGKAWKLKQFEYQDEKCAYCDAPLRFADSVVHHVLSLKEFGSAANKPDNFRLLHPGCNLKIGTKFFDFQ